MSDATTSAAGPVGGLRRIPFTTEQEGRIRGLASWIAAAGWINLATAAFTLIKIIAYTRNVSELLDVLLKLLIGIWCLRAGSAFRRVATTDEADQAHVVTAFENLRAIFLLQSVMIILMLSFLAAIFLIGFLAVLAHPRAG